MIGANLKRISLFEAIWSCGGASAFLAVPLVLFLKHQGYPLGRPETLVLLGLTLLTGMLCGLIMTWGRTAGRVVVVTALVVLLVDVQTNWITTLGLRLLLNILGWGFLCWLLRRHLPRILVWVAVPMLVAAVLTPGPPARVVVGEPGPQAGDREDLPLVLHIILDEQIGPAGIPAEFDPDGQYAEILEEGYTDRGFTVHGRAYSRYASTAQSVSNLLNGVASSELSHWFSGGFTRGALLESNAWFDILRARGYRFHVVQSDYLKYLDTNLMDGSGGDTVFEFGTHNLVAFADAPLSVSQKIPFVLGTYFRLSYFLKSLAEGFDRLKASTWGGRLPLPDWYLSGTRIGPLEAMNTLDRLCADLEKAGPGQAWFAHIMMPHFPYGFRGDCTLEPDVRRWLEARDFMADPMRNTPDSRAERYALYLEQVKCVQQKLQDAFDSLDRRGLWDEALVVVHGDHGSRISLWEGIPVNAQKMSPADYADLFSTFFAVKGPDIPAESGDRLLPVDHLFRALVLEGRPSGDPALEADPQVYLIYKDEMMGAAPLPPFPWKKN